MPGHAYNGYIESDAMWTLMPLLASNNRHWFLQTRIKLWTYIYYGLQSVTHDY